MEISSPYLKDKDQKGLWCPLTKLNENINYVNNKLFSPPVVIMLPLSKKAEFFSFWIVTLKPQLSPSLC